MHVANRILSELPYLPLRIYKFLRKYIESVSPQASVDLHWIQSGNSVFQRKEYLVYWFLELSPFKEDQILLPFSERRIKLMGTRRFVFYAFSLFPLFNRSPIEMVFFRQGIDALLGTFNFFPYG